MAIPCFTAPLFSHAINCHLVRVIGQQLSALDAESYTIALVNNRYPQALIPFPEMSKEQLLEPKILAFLYYCNHERFNVCVVCHHTGIGYLPINGVKTQSLLDPSLHIEPCVTLQTEPGICQCVLKFEKGLLRDEDCAPIASYFNGKHGSTAKTGLDNLIRIAGFHNLEDGVHRLTGSGCPFVELRTPSTHKSLKKPQDTYCPEASSIAALLALATTRTSQDLMASRQTSSLPTLNHDTSFPSVPRIKFDPDNPQSEYDESAKDFSYVMEKKLAGCDDDEVFRLFQVERRQLSNFHGNHRDYIADLIKYAVIARGIWREVSREHPR